MKKLVFLIILGGLIAGGVWAYSWYAANWNIVVDKETHLTAEYKSNQLELDTYVKGMLEGTQLANVKSDKLRMVLHDAVSGRYGDSKGDINNRNGQGGSFFSAIVEAYPNIQGQMDIYDMLVNRVFAGREAFKQKQQHILNEATGYERWLHTDPIKSWAVRTIIGAPTDLLQANVGKGNTLHGSAALEQMKLVVTSSRTNQSFDSGEEEPLQIPGTAPGSQNTGH
jgi:hypothetical protein